VVAHSKCSGIGWRAVASWLATRDGLSPESEEEAMYQAVINAEPVAFLPASGPTHVFQG